MHTSERWPALAGLAGRQENVVELGQLFDLGFTRAEVRELEARRILHRLHRGVYAYGSGDIGKDSQLRAAYLAAGATAFFSHRTAAGLLQIQGLYARTPHLSVVGRQPRRPGVIIHRTTPPHEDELTTRRGFRCSSAIRVLIELAATESHGTLAKLIESADRRNLLHRRQVEPAFERHARRPGIANLAAALAGYRPRPFDKSGLEKSIAAAIAADPGIPAPIRNFIHPVRELDFWWPALMLNGEADGGPFHKTPDDIRRDKLNDRKLAALGITVVRITDDQWEYDQSDVMADLRATVALRRAA